MPENTEAAAPVSGEITETGYNIYNGNYLRLKTSEGLIVTYAHLNEVLVSVKVIRLEGAKDPEEYIRVDG